MTEPDITDDEIRAAMFAVPAPDSHDGCADHIRNIMAVGGVEVTVRAANPLIASQWTRGMTCPHGTTYWYEPTGEQHAKWAREGTP